MEDTVENKSGNSVKNILLIILFTVLLGIIGVLVWLNVQQGGKIDEQETEITKKSEEYAALEKEMQTKIDELNALKTELNEKGVKIDELEKMIKELEEQKNNLSKTAASASAAWQQLADAKKKLADADAYQSKLTQKIDSLQANNVVLTDSIFKVTTKYSATLDTLKQKQDSISYQKSQLEIAYILEAENLKITAYNDKGKDITKAEMVGKDIFKLDVMFNFRDNKVAPKNKKNVMLRVVEPTGAVLTDPASGGGSFNDSRGKTLSYTMKQDVVFNNTKQVVSFSFSKGSAYILGTHTVEVYADGYLIGTGTFYIKK